MSAAVFELAGTRPAPGAMSKCKVCGELALAQGSSTSMLGVWCPHALGVLGALSIAKGRGCALSVQNRPKGMVDARSSLTTCLWTVLSAEGYLRGVRNWIKHALSESCSG